jgi:GNAT superfamily N-acetyltransferase
MTDSVVPDPEEHLADGWEPETPADDTLIRQAVEVHASWPVAVAASTGRPARRTDDWAAAWIGDRGALTNVGVVTRPMTDPSAVIAGIGEVIPAHVPFLLVDPWPGELAAHGLTSIGHPPLMVRFPGPGPDTTPTGVEVREVADAASLALAERILVEGYPMPEMQPLSPGDLFGPGLLDGTTQVWLGYVDGEPMSVAAAHHTANATLVEYVATLPAARGRGAGSAVTWAATLSQPDASAMLLASDDGRPVYERMGYQALIRWSAWLRPAS